DDARHDVRFALLAERGEPLPDPAPEPMVDEIRNDVGVEQVAHDQRSTGSGGGSSISGNRSSSPSSSFHFAITARNAFREPPGAAGSIISRSPSLPITASVPGNSNSRGIRTAWFCPLRNSLTWRSGIAGLRGNAYRAHMGVAYASANPISSPAAMMMTAVDAD